MQLKRGPLMLVAGGAILAASFIIASLYVAPQVTTGENGDEYRIAAGGTLEIERRITTGQGLYTVFFPELIGSPLITVKGPDNATLVERAADSTLVVGVVEAGVQGNYTLTVSNLAESELGTRVFFEEQAPINIATSFILYAGLIVIAAGAAVTILDRVRSKKMKQYGDVSDLR